MTAGLSERIYYSYSLQYWQFLEAEMHLLPLKPLLNYIINMHAISPQCHLFTHRIWKGETTINHSVPKMAAGSVNDVKHSSMWHLWPHPNQYCHWKCFSWLRSIWLCQRAIFYIAARTYSRNLVKWSVVQVAYEAVGMTLDLCELIIKQQHVVEMLWLTWTFLTSSFYSL